MVPALVGVLAVGALGWGMSQIFGPIGRAEAQVRPMSRNDSHMPVVLKEMPSHVKSLVVGGGCFWCLEPLFENLKGVEDVEVAYAGGARAGVTYQEVCTGQSGHAEVLKVSYDPGRISAEDLLRVFFTIHDPTTLNRQGPDTGPQYRSVVFYATPEEKALAQKIIDELTRSKVWGHPIVTSLEPLKNYTRAEEYHQDYYKTFEKAPPEVRASMNVGYCAVVIAPKVLKFREKLKHLMKD